MDEVAQFLSESQGDIYPSMKFQNLKDFVKGTIIETRMDKRESRFRPGEIEQSLLVSLEVMQGRGVVGLKVDEGKADEQPIDDHKHVTVWVKQGLMAAAVSQAVREAGAKTLSPGGTFVLAFVDTKDTGKVNPAKIYKASYEPPATDCDSFMSENAISTGSFDGDDIPF